MTTLILAGDVILSASPLVEETAEGYITPDGIFPFRAGVTGKVEVSDLPAGFHPALYLWDGGLVRRDPPPMTADQARAALAITDGQFDPRWLEDLVGGEMHERYLTWSNRRDELRAVIRGG